MLPVLPYRTREQVCESLCFSFHGVVGVPSCQRAQDGLLRQVREQRRGTGLACREVMTQDHVCELVQNDLAAVELRCRRGMQDVIAEARVEPDPEESVFGEDSWKLDDLDPRGARTLDRSDEIVEPEGLRQIERRQGGTLLRITLLCHQWSPLVVIPRNFLVQELGDRVERARRDITQCAGRERTNLRYAHSPDEIELGLKPIWHRTVP